MTQTKTAHTPGPWNYEADGVIGWFDISSKNVPRIAEAIDNEANAHLIAAAPELGAELKNIQRWHQFGVNRADLERVNALLVKAGLL